MTKTYFTKDIEDYLMENGLNPMALDRALKYDCFPVVQEEALLLQIESVDRMLDKLNVVDESLSTEEALTSFACEGKLETLEELNVIKFLVDSLGEFNYYPT